MIEAQRQPLPCLFAIEALKVAYGRKVVLEIERLEIPAHSSIAIIGPNGAGKSTLLQSLLRDTRHVRCHGEPVGTRLRRGGIAFVAQHPLFSTPLTVTEYVLLGRYPHLAWYTRPSAQDRMMAQTLLRQFDLTDLAHCRVAALSGGEQQRAAIVRALMQETRVILLDEPNNHLDIRHQHLFMRELRAFQQTRPINCLMVLHDLGLAANYCDHVILMSKGRIEAAGSPQEVMTESCLTRVYEWPVRPYRLENGGVAFDTLGVFAA
ncbi:MAG: ABC transporter ATP-binding protein [Zoogloeaceae bacterium]|jgi:iron complex transport system ATP-binding protein|nr:ABC transporter ATP-binding protein [Zoogloeaceae bacterium]